jgi:hypothetical protein
MTTADAICLKALRDLHKELEQASPEKASDIYERIQNILSVLARPMGNRFVNPELDKLMN